MYYSRFLPFLNKGYMEMEVEQEVAIKDVFCPDGSFRYSDKVKSDFKPSIIHVNPLGIKVFNMSDDKISYLKRNFNEDKLFCKVKYIDYEDVARRIEYDDVTQDAYLKVRNDYDVGRGVITSEFIDFATIHQKMDSFPDIDFTVGDKEFVSFSKLAREQIEKLEESLKMDNVDNLISKVNKALVNEEMPPELADMSNDYMSVVKGDNKRGRVDTSKDAVYEQLYGYLSSPNFDQEQVPLLLGPTAVMKSQSVKVICKELGYRLVDFRVAFTSRLDYNGLYERTKVDGDWWSDSCPMEELVTCSSGFLDYAVKAYAKIKDILDKGHQEVATGSDGSSKNVEFIPLNGDQKKALLTLLKEMSKYVREEGDSVVAITPVLFFDEITRLDDAGVEGVLTTLLNSKQLGDISLDRCKFVAASNTPVDNFDALEEIYDAKDSHDSAYAKRFVPIVITPLDVMDRWIKWAKSPITEVVKDENGNEQEVESGNFNIHPHVMEYLESDQAEIYNQQYQIDAGVEDVGTARLTPFPNYRTWVMVSDYVYAINHQAPEGKKPTLIRSTIKGLVGESVGNKVSKHLIDTHGYTESKSIKGDDGDDLDEIETFIQESGSAGIPAILVGPSSLGKTARVKRYAKQTGAEMIVITLSALERADLMGFPVKESIEDFASGSVDFVKSNLRGVKRELEQIIAKQNDSNAEGFDPNLRIASQLTTKAPSRSISKRFEEAYRAKKNIILFFDECNRVTNPAIMSALFEAVSDNRIFGIDFDPKRVQIFGAMNYGESYTGAEAPDSALTARFSIFKKDRYDEKDVDSYIKYLKRTSDPSGVAGYNHEILLSFIEDKIKKNGKKSLVKWFEEVENQNIREGSPCSRSFESLSKEITNMSTSDSFMGRVIFESPSVRGAMTNFHGMYKIDDPKQFSDQYANYKDFLLGIMPLLDSWNAKRSGATLQFDNGNILTADKLVSSLKSIYQSQFHDQIYNYDKEKTWVDVKNLTRSILMNMDELDKNTSSKRQSVFKNFIGESAAIDFTNHFNAVFGGTKVTITLQQLVDKNLIRPFFEQELGAEMVSPDAMIANIVSLTGKFMNVHGEKLSSDHYREFLERSLTYLPIADNILRAFSAYGNNALDGFVGLAEGSDPDYIEKLLKRAGKSLPDRQTIEDMIRKIKGDMGGVASGIVRNKSKLL